MLAAARAAAGLELTDIARETRVPLRHLKALEADKHDELPALPYAIGFVKSFARAVGLDPETVAGQFRGETSKVPHVPAPLSLEPLDERRLPSRGLVFASIGIVVAIIAGLSAWGSGMFDPAMPAAPMVVVAPETATPDTMATSADAGTEAVAPGATAPAATTSLPGATAAGPVILTAKEEVWVKIYDKATRTSAKIGVLQAGESYTVPADPPGLMLWTGKAGALAITVAGKPIPALGGPVDTVRDVSLAAADLIARSQPGVGGTAAAPAGPKPIATVPGA
jgi:cytoskeletal protein RodZ